MLFGRDVAQLDRAESGLRRRIGVVFQDFRLLDHMTRVRQSGPAAAARRRQRRADLQPCLRACWRWLGLGEVIEKKPGELSMGQRQLVAVGRAVIVRPSLLLADEPTSSVDPARGRRLMHLFLSLHRLGTAVVLRHPQRAAGPPPRLPRAGDGGRPAAASRAAAAALPLSA